MELLDQIESSLNGRQYLVALFAAVSLPDICGALGSSDGLASGAKSAAWFDAHVGHLYSNGDIPVLNGWDIYKFRCSLLHQGSLVPDSRGQRPSYTRLCFLEPNPSLSTHLNAELYDGERIVDLDVIRFCQELVAAVRGWLTKAGSDPIVSANLRNSIQRYPRRLRGFDVGYPVIT